MSHAVILASTISRPKPLPKPSLDEVGNLINCFGYLSSSSKFFFFYPWLLIVMATDMGLEILKTILSSSRRTILIGYASMEVNRMFLFWLLCWNTFFLAGKCGT